MVETQMFVNSLKDGLGFVNSDDDAEKVLDTISYVVTNALKNRDAVYIKGVGELRSEPENGGKHVVFTPSPTLLQGINE